MACLPPLVDGTFMGDLQPWTRNLARLLYLPETESVCHTFWAAARGETHCALATGKLLAEMEAGSIFVLGVSAELRAWSFDWALLEHAEDILTKSGAPSVTGPLHLTVVLRLLKDSRAVGLTNSDLRVLHSQFDMAMFDCEMFMGAENHSHWEPWPSWTFSRQAKIVHQPRTEDDDFYNLKQQVLHLKLHLDDIAHREPSRASRGLGPSPSGPELGVPPLAPPRPHLVALRGGIKPAQT